MYAWLALWSIFWLRPVLTTSAYPLCETQVIRLFLYWFILLLKPLELILSFTYKVLMVLFTDVEAGKEKKLVSHYSMGHDTDISQLIQMSTLVPIWLKVNHKSVCINLDCLISNSHSVSFLRLPWCPPHFYLHFYLHFFTCISFIEKMFDKIGIDISECFPNEATILIISFLSLHTR